MGDSKNITTKGTMSDKDRILAFVKAMNSNAHAETIIRCLIDAFFSDDPEGLAHINEAVSARMHLIAVMTNKRMEMIHENSIYLQDYLNGKMFTDEEAAKANLSKQLEHIETICRLSGGINHE